MLNFQMLHEGRNNQVDDDMEKLFKIKKENTLSISTGVIMSRRGNTISGGIST